MPSLSAVQTLLNGVGLHYDVNLWFGLFALVFARVMGAVMFAPFLGGRSVPGQIKAGLGFVLTAVMLPSLASTTTALPPSSLAFVALLVKEVVIGSILGFLAQLVFLAVQLAGTIVDTQRGLNQVTFLAPQLEGHPSALGAAQFQAALAVFFGLQGHLMFISALMKSFQQLPIIEFPKMSSGLMPIADQVIRTSADTLLLGCQIAAPIVLALFLVDVAFASAGRIAQQIRISPDAFTAKSLLGLALAWLLTAAFLDQLRPALVGMFRSIDNVVRLLH